VEIFSWQFYIILNVIRNVLIVPPPASASSKRNVCTQTTVRHRRNIVFDFLESPRKRNSSALLPSGVTTTTQRGVSRIGEVGCFAVRRRTDGTVDCTATVRWNVLADRKNICEANRRVIW
jgi:hypothetical protein